VVSAELLIPVCVLRGSNPVTCKVKGKGKVVPVLN
jgi:hypothetical protein